MSSTTALRNTLRWRFLRNLPDKVLSRLDYLRERGQAGSVAAWCREHEVDAVELMRSRDADLAAEAEAVGERIAAHGREVLASRRIPAATAADHRLLYFLVRSHRPENVVETGVAAGFSSEAILSALDANGHGHLWSSELPYVRLPDPESEVGVVVSDEHRRRWTLFLDGDRANLRRIAAEAPTVDLLHYDSDKARRGRRFALRRLDPRLADGATLVFDDIDDNGHFRDLVESTGASFFVVAAPGKWVGVIEGWDPAAAGPA